jgi:hypothetical protein
MEWFTIHLHPAIHLQHKENKMAHYAELDNTNHITRVVVINDAYDQTEAMGQAFCKALFKTNNWKKTSYNATIRKNFATIGGTYDMIRDAFIPPKPFPSWMFNEATCRWDAPVAIPDPLKKYLWDEITVSWVER